MCRQSSTVIPVKVKTEPDRPTGRAQIRRAVLRAATKQFALKGTSASLREIAAEAGVNLGLIHRHFGKKDDLLREVLAQGRRHGAIGLRGAHSAPQAIQRMFLGSVADTDHVRIVAWMALLDAAQEWPTADQRTIAVVREMQPRTDERDLRLLAALAVIYGWSLFSTEMLSAFEVSPAQRPGVERRLAVLLGELVQD